MKLFSSFPPLPTPGEMAHWDEAAVKLGFPEILLMENASREALHVLEKHVTTLRGTRVLLYMGAGKNGGDTACLARHLRDQGAQTLVLHTRSLGTYKGVTAKHLRLARLCGVPFLPVLASKNRWPVDWRQPDIIIDGLLGTGFAGQLKEQMHSLVDMINTMGEHSFILALDVPSGLDSLSGRPKPVAVRANVTVCFEAAKPGLVLPEAAPYTGQLYTRRIGIPADIVHAHPPSYRLLDTSCVRFLPHTASGVYKGSYGHVFVLGGSEGLTGAAHLAALGALRMGCGLVSVAAPGGLCTEIKAAVPEIMSFPLGRGNSWKDAVASGAMDKLLPLEGKASVLVIGPGMGYSQEAGELLSALLSLPHRPPAVIDADALTLLAKGLIPFEVLNTGDILTPHPGEAGSFLGVSAQRVQEDRFAAMRDLCGLHSALWILKGSGSLLGQKGYPVLIAPHHVPCLAVGGSGDVLAGCIGSLLAQGCTALLAASFGVLAHIRAGKLLEESFPGRGNTASEIAQMLPRAKSVLMEQYRHV
ncbi:MAG: NAD(P)H-hydrate dehydratase [Betaproteobacteria bacterium]|nr:NAD(P)H-hydrate dehydratase [Betaproteobacteria bacterium]